MTIYPEALASHLEGAVTTVCHCWRVTRRNGTVAGFTDHDGALTVDGTLFEPRSGFSATEARDTLGLAADTVDIEGALSSVGIVDADIVAGLYDGATVETLLVNWREPTVFARLRKATIGRITLRDHAFVAELKSLSHALDQVNGRYVMRACDAELGDARCGFLLDQDGYRATASVASVETREIFTASWLDGFAAGWFSHGTLTWSSGARAGRTDRIIDHRKGISGVSLILRPYDGPAAEAGDTFTVRAGCDKSFSACKAKFGNFLNFRGFPHLPGNDAAYGYVTDGAIFDGGALVT